ncbi:MAG TPA: fumarylacetoacetate hydrolase family protein [Pseudomonadales bacterium]|nr:fumarylacetoacetate hydrolase family protein [Pseudomonadales bacterium]
MKLVRYGPRDQERPGLIDGDGCIRDLTAHLTDIAGDALTPTELERIAAIDARTLPLVSGEPRVGPCVAGVGKFICVGLNYSDHALESGMDVPSEPVPFMKATTAIVGPNDNIEIPPGAAKVDWEVELGVVIGKSGRYIPKEKGLDHVAGYCVINDISERAYQLGHGGQWCKGKGFDTFAPMGPWLVTQDEIYDPQSLDMWLEVDGMRYQSGNTQTMVFDVVTLVSYISRFMSLQAGDVISTGTPPGVGMGQTPHAVYLRAGQKMRLGISGLGEQHQLTVDADLGGV